MNTGIRQYTRVALYTPYYTPNMALWAPTRACPTHLQD